MNEQERIAAPTFGSYDHPIMESSGLCGSGKTAGPVEKVNAAQGIADACCTALKDNPNWPYPPGVLPPPEPTRIFETLKINAYDATVYLVCGNREYINFLMERTPHWTPFGEEDEQGMVFWSNSREFFVLLDYSKVSLRLILHEGYHLTNTILDEKGAFYGAENDEHGALLHEYVTEWIYNTLKKERVL
jgi:hypothetical protein